MVQERRKLWTKRDKALNRVKELIEKGKSKGVLTYKEIMDMLEEIELEADQIGKIYETGTLE